MPRSAPGICKTADMKAMTPEPLRRPSADDLLVLLAVGRTGRFVSAADELGIDHTTVSRRIAALERALGGRVLARASGGWELTDLGRGALAAAEAVEAAVRSLGADGGRTLEGVVRISATDGFSAYVAAPAAVRVQRRHPRIAVELVAATRRASTQRSGLDLEVVVGRPRVLRAQARRLGDYCLGLYASRGYLAEHGAPDTVGELHRHPLVYFIEAMLQVDDLDLASSFAPAMRESVSSTNVFVHVEATRAAAGLGLLPCFMADRHPDLVRVLPDKVAVRLSYWLVARAETLRRPEVSAVVDAIDELVTEQRHAMLGATAEFPYRTAEFPDSPTE
ncbi:LysR family transcriptional regulator [Nocardia sp. NEAU-G5]|uniref:LysR family transcriptional regulator n=2 Tax=Nocardia albiluteola TaxID=2842303 RepID=A0ABS6AVS9_9NOCA|nr:LysR family transcriptional regulator [Nocardia albiluteola]